MKITIGYKDKDGNVVQAECPWAHAIRRRSRPLRWESRARELDENAKVWNGDGLAEYERQIVLGHLATLQRISLMVEQCSLTLAQVVENRSCQLYYLDQAGDAIRHYDLAEYCRQEFGVAPSIGENAMPKEYEHLFEGWTKKTLSQDDLGVKLVSWIEHCHILAEAILGIAGHTLINELKIADKLKDLSGAMYLVMCDFARHRYFAVGMIPTLVGSWTSKKKKARREKLIVEIKSCVESTCAYVDRVCTEQAIPTKTINAVCLEVRRSADFTLDQFGIACHFKTRGTPAWVKLVETLEHAAQEHDEFIDGVMGMIGGMPRPRARKQAE